MNSLRALALPLLGLALLATPAAAQTKPTPKKPTRMVSNKTPAARAADPLRGTAGPTGPTGNNVYAAPGEPVDVRKNGRNTPSYDGPAAGHGTSKGMTMPPKQ